MSFKEVTLKIRPPPHSWVIELLKFGPVRVEILDCKPEGKDKVNEVFEIKCDPKYIRKIKKILSNSKYIDLFEVLSIDQHKGRIYGILRTSHCNVCKLFSSSSECFLGSAIYDVEKEEKCLKYVKWTLIVHVNLLQEIIKRLTENGLEVHIDSIASIGIAGSPNELTIKQEQILKLAWKLGLFEFPKKITLKKFSMLIGLSPSTVSEILRLGLRKLVTLYFKNKGKRIQNA